MNFQDGGRFFPLSPVKLLIIAAVVIVIIYVIKRALASRKPRAVAARPPQQNLQAEVAPPQRAEIRRCPQCQRPYSDPMIAFCLADGALLSSPLETGASRNPAPTVAYEPPPTEVLRPDGPPTVQKR